MDGNRRRHDLALLAVAVAAVSTSAPLVREASAPTLAIAMWRNLLAAAAIVPWAFARHHHELREVDDTERRVSLVAGAFLAAHFATWIPSLSFTTVASSVALVATQPVWAAVIARARGDDVTSRTWTGIAVAVAGVVLLTGVDVSLSVRALAGDLLALAGGVLAAAYVTVGARARQTLSTTVYTAICYSTAAVLLLVVCAAGRQQVAGYDSRTWLVLVALTAGPQLLGHSVFNRVLRTTSPTVVSVSILFEIVGASLLAWAWFGETPPLAAVPAAALITAGVALVIRP